MKPTWNQSQWLFSPLQTWQEFKVFVFLWELKYDMSTSKNNVLWQNLFLPFYLLICPHHISSQVLLPLNKKYIPLHAFYFYLFTLLEPIVNNWIIHLLLFLLTFTTSIDSKTSNTHISTKWMCSLVYRERFSCFTLLFYCLFSNVDSFI